MKRICLSTKMVVYTVLCFLALVPATVYLSLGYFEEQFKKSIAEQQFLLVSRIADELDQKILSAHTVLVQASQLITPAMVADPNSAERFLDNRLGLKALFDNGLYLLTPSGHLIAETATKPNRRGADCSYRDYIRKTIETKKPCLSNPYVSSQQHRHPVVMFTAPVLDRDDRLLAIFAGSIDLLKANFLGSLSVAKVGKAGYFYLTTTDRTIVMMPDKSRILTMVPVGMNRLYDRAINGYEGCDEIVTSAGLQTLTAFKRLRSAPWLLAANYPVAEAFAPVRRAETSAWLIVAGGGVLITILFWLIMRHLTRPLLSVTSQIRNSGRELDQVKLVQSDSNDEIGELAEVFNTLMGRLKAKEQELRRSNELHQLLADNSSTWVFWMTPTGEMTYVSPACTAISGYSVEELMASPETMAAMVHPADRELWFAHLASNGEPLPENDYRNLELRIVTKAGETRWLRHSCRPLFDRDGRLLGVRGSNSDITEQHQFAEAMRAERDQAQNYLDVAGVLIVALNTDGRVILVNNAGCATLGYGEEEILGRNWFDLCVPEAIRVEVKGLFSLLMSGTLVPVEYYENHVLRKTGEQRLLAFHSTLLHNHAGEVSGVLFSGEDITERTRAVEALKQAVINAEGERAKSEAIIAALGEPLCIHDRDFRLIYQNRNHRELFGEHTNKICYEALRSAEVVCGDCPVALAFADGQIHMVERSMVKDGTTVYLENTVSPLRDGNGTIVAAVELVRDITGRKLVQDEIRGMNEELERRVTERTTQLENLNSRLADEIKARAETQEEVSWLNLDLERRAAALEAANKELESFSYSVSHDLRAPLRHINSFSRILLEDYAITLDRQGQDYLLRLCSASQRMGALIDDLLNLSRVTRSDMRFLQVDLSAIARDVALELQETELDRTVHFAIEERVNVWGDPLLLRLVMQNLLGNAWKYSARNNRAEIQFGTIEQKGKLACYVRDNGVGFDMAYADKLFGAFQRLHGADEYEGTGIGLATVQRIVRRHGGQVWAEGTVGEGATFFFILPA